MPTLYTVTIDTEEEWDWTAGWPTSGLSVANIQQLPKFQDLCTRYGVATTYFTDRAVLDDAKARDVILDLARRPKVEIGMHIHPWNTPPLDGKPVEAWNTFIHNLPADLARAKLQTVYERFQEHGLHPTSYRGGRYSSGPVVQRFLRERGFRADASVVPFTTWHDAKAPDYRDRDLEPVRLPGEPPLWEVPLTLGFTRRPHHLWRRTYELVENTWLQKLRLVGLAEKVGLVRKVWLNFEFPLGRYMQAFLRQLRRRPLPAICFTMHSSSLLVGGNPYSRTAADVERIYRRMEAAFETLADWPEFVPATVTEVAVQLEKNVHARVGN